MQLEFTGIYRLLDVSLNYLGVPQIAMAPRRVEREVPELGGVQEVLEFLVPNEVNFGHAIIGMTITDEDSLLELQDLVREGDDGEPVIWRFEPLTLAVWTEMGEAGHVAGWEALKSSITDDATLIHFYQHDWLLPWLEWWKESPESPDATPPENDSDLASAE